MEIHFSCHLFNLFMLLKRFKVKVGVKIFYLSCCDMAQVSIVRAAREEVLRHQEKERFEVAEQEWTQERLDLQHQLEKFVVQCEQMEREFHESSKDSQNLREALEERTRQADNWKAMYEALKSGTPMPSAAPRTPTGHGMTPTAATMTRNINGMTSLTNNTGRSSFDLPNKNPVTGYSSASESTNRFAVAASPFRYTSAASAGQSSQPVSNAREAKSGHGHLSDSAALGSSRRFTSTSWQQNNNSRGFGSSSSLSTTPPLRNLDNHPGQGVLTFHSAASPSVVAPASSREEVRRYNEGEGPSKRSRMSSNFVTIPLDDSPQMHHQRHSKIFAKLSQDLEKSARTGNKSPFIRSGTDFARRLSGSGFGRGNNERS
jgi:hypothetical protein